MFNMAPTRYRLPLSKAKRREHERVYLQDTCSSFLTSLSWGVSECGSEESVGDDESSDEEEDVYVVLHRMVTSSE